MNKRVLDEHESSYAHGKAMVEAGLATDAAKDLLWVQRRQRELAANAPATPPPSGGGMSVWGSEGRGSGASHNGSLPSQRAKKPEPPEIKVPLGVEITWEQPDEAASASGSSSSSSGATARADWRRQQIARGADWGALLEGVDDAACAQSDKDKVYRWRQGQDALGIDDFIITPPRPPTSDSMRHGVSTPLSPPHGAGGRAAAARVGVEDVEKAQVLGQYWLEMIKTSLAQHVEPGALGPYSLRPHSGIRIRLDVAQDGASGLRWRQVEKEDAVRGHEITCSLLAQQLQQGVTDFTREQLDFYGVGDLSCDSYIKVGEAFFTPAEEHAQSPTRDDPGETAEEEEVDAEAVMRQLKQQTEDSLMEHLSRVREKPVPQVRSDMRVVGWLWKRNHDCSGNSAEDWRERLCFLELDTMGYYSEQRGSTDKFCELTHICHIRRVAFPEPGHEHAFELILKEDSSSLPDVSLIQSFVIKDQTRKSFVFACSSADEVTKWTQGLIRYHRPSALPSAPFCASPSHSPSHGPCF